MKLLLRLRHEPDSLTTVWLIQRDGPTQHGLLHGTLYRDRAEDLAKTLEAAGVTVERSETQMRSAEDAPKKAMARQQTLFEESQ